MLWPENDGAMLQKQIGGMVELVDTLDSKSGFFGSAGSSPATGTKHTLKPLQSLDCRGFFVHVVVTVPT